MRQQQQRRVLLPSLLAPGAVATLAPRLLDFVPGLSRPVGRPQPRVAVAYGTGLGGPSLEDVKATLMDLLSDRDISMEVLKPEGKPTRGRMDEAILRLEALSTNNEPVYSQELDGTWTVQYTGSFAPGVLPTSPTRELAMFLYGGGYSLGNLLTSVVGGFWGQNLGLKEGPRSVRIQGGRDIDATAEIEVAGQKQTIAYTAELMPLSARRMSEEILTVELPGPIGKQDLPFELRRSMLITYLDNEVMVVRDENGVPEVLMKELAKVEPLVPDSMSDVSSATNVTTDNATAVVVNTLDAANATTES